METIQIENMNDSSLNSQINNYISKIEILEERLRINKITLKKLRKEKLRRRGLKD